MAAQTEIPSVWSLTAPEFLEATPDFVRRYTDDQRGAAFGRIAMLFDDREDMVAAQQLWAPAVMNFQPTRPVKTERTPGGATGSSA